MGKDAQVLDEFGAVRGIESYEQTFSEDSIKCFNYTKKVKNTRIALFMKKKSNHVYKVKTSAGYETTATEDHPFYTPQGMTELRMLNTGSQVAVYPFKGVAYENPSSDLIVDEQNVRSMNLSKTSEHQIIKTLKSKNILPLRLNSSKLPYLIKLFGFILGDGTIYFTKTKGTICFYGKPEDLESIRLDIKNLGFKPSKVYKRRREHKIRTQYRDYEFSKMEYSFKTTSTSLARLLQILGMPTGNKAQQDYLIPNWLLNAKKWQKRLFLSSFFGAELSSPSTITGHPYNFYCPILSANKSKSNIASGLKFLEQVSKLLQEFNVKSKLIEPREDIVNGKILTRLRLQISQRNDDLIRLWSNIGFEYNKKKIITANIAVFWIKKKEEFLRKNLIPNIRVAQQRGIHFPDFKSFVKNNKVESGLVWDTITLKELEPYEDYVYDFTVESEHHNFIADGFVVSNCGVRLLRTDWLEKDVTKDKVKILDEIFKEVPAGVGKGGITKLPKNVLLEVLDKGSEWAVKEGYGTKDDLLRTEEDGRMKGADSKAVSERALSRGLPQLGTLGSGNHFLEIQKVGKIYNQEVAKAFGIEREGQVTVMTHCGSRGLGHQVASDYIQKMESQYGFNHLPDRELVNAPINSDLGRQYYAAMCCAINYAFTNRQMITHWVRDCFKKVMGSSEGMNMVYDVCHNLAKFEKHKVDGKTMEVCVHRKGATRSFGPGREEIPQVYRSVGQPVIIPGSMGTASYLLVGTKRAEEVSFGSTAHGAGRLASRAEAMRRFRGSEIKEELHKKGIELKAASWQGIAEEAPQVYKDIHEVIRVSHSLELGNTVARLVPLAVMKG